MAHVFSNLRTLSETEDEYVVHGHSGVMGDLPEERFDKKKFMLTEENGQYVFSDKE